MVVFSLAIIFITIHEKILRLTANEGRFKMSIRYHIPMTFLRKIITACKLHKIIIPTHKLIVSIQIARFTEAPI